MNVVDRNILWILENVFHAVQLVIRICRESFGFNFQVSESLTPLKISIWGDFLGLLLDLLLVFVDFYIESENEGRAFAPLWDEVQGSIEVYDYIFWNVEPKPDFFTVRELE